MVSAHSLRESVVYFFFNFITRGIRGRRVWCDVWIVWTSGQEGSGGKRYGLISALQTYYGRGGYKSTNKCGFYSGPGLAICKTIMKYTYWRRQSVKLLPQLKIHSRTDHVQSVFLFSIVNILKKRNINVCGTWHTVCMFPYVKYITRHLNPRFINGRRVNKRVA